MSVPPLKSRLDGLPEWALGLVLIAAGALAGFGQAPFGLPILTVVALALGLFLVNRAHGTRRFWHGWALGLGYFGHVMAWIVEPFLVDIARHGWMAAPALFLMAGGLALFWGIAARLSQGVWSLALGIALAEVARSFVLSGLPWGLVGYVWIDREAYQLARFIGPHGVTALTFLLGATMVGRSHILRGVGLVVAVLAVSVAPLAWTPDTQVGPMVRILSPNVLQQDKWHPDTREAMYQRHLDLTQGPPVDLVVWPESALTMQLSATRSDILAAAGDAPVLLGHQYSPDFETFFNAATVLDAKNADGDAIYLKSKLVPFGEYIPLTPIARRFGLTGLADAAGLGFSEGQGAVTVPVRGIGKVQILICYEGIFPHFVGSLTGRPRAIVLITNDGWFGTRGGPAQHLAQAQARAIEQGLPVVRSANRGISAMIDARGQVTRRVGFDETTRLDAVLPDADPATVYAKIGDVPIALLFLLGFAAFAWCERGAFNRP